MAGYDSNGLGPPSLPDEEGLIVDEEELRVGPPVGPPAAVPEVKEEPPPPQVPFDIPVLVMQKMR